MIPAELTSCFTHGVRARGEQYVAGGRIRLAPAGALRVRGVARGTSSWVITLEAREDHGLQMSCNCPFAQDRGFCKHLWGTLRLADQRGLLKPLLKAADGVFVDASGGDDLWAEGDGDEELAALDELLLRDVSGVDENPSAPLAELPTPVPAPAWRRVIETVKQNAQYEPPPPAPQEWPNDRRLIYLADLAASASAQGLVIELATEKRDRDGTWAVPKLFRSGIESWMAIPDPIDREIGEMLRGSRRVTEWTRMDSTMGFVLAPNAFDTVLRLMSETGRLRMRRDPRERPVESAHWDAGAVWQIHYLVERGGDPRSVTLLATLERAGETMTFDRVDLIHPAGFLVCDQTIARLDVSGPFALVAELSTNGPITLSEGELPALVGALSDLPRPPQLELPDGLSVCEVAPQPVPMLTLTRFADAWRRDQFFAALSFDYDGMAVSGSRAGVTVFDSRNNRIIRRDRDVEAAAGRLLSTLGVRIERDWRTGGTILTMPANRFEPLLFELTGAGWRVFIDGIAHRMSSGMRANVRSGVDWFDLEIDIAFGDIEVSLPRLLAALRTKESTIDLDDGSVGMISADVRQRLTPLLAMTTGGHGLRFRHSQTALLDALIATLPAVETDQRFAQARAELQTFARVEAAEEPETFRGELRPYQREGLGWFHFLRRFGLGGCLADDMGLGKTVQVLALLESRRIETAAPSLVVVPRSLVFNWRQEAERFTPELRVLDHTGVGRARAGIALTDENLVITTYGTLRRDITAFRQLEFDYVILDEAQAIKNATTASAKAARLLRGRHRLALTGTPIENRVEELWSLFEFLNPGMLGAATTFKALARVRTPGVHPAHNDATDTALLARTLRPVILRRTKDRVAPELPAKVEQTLMVELEPAQRRVYDELLAHYRRSLLPYVERMGMARSKLKVLEALLRLRQAACHPSLITHSREDAPSAKLDVLMPKLAEAAAEAHKSLVFSQFTSFLALLRDRLDADAVAYTYLDGDTRDREAVVERFQHDPECRLFLISLRAGGHGLNLTAADYVFLLDPWWNPAVEAQAIDRAHRIGQRRHVIATRLVARGTIEEKILELQRSKRDLADAILSEDQGTLAKIGREELELLLT
jgi:superfamily II DNA or RNA helicase